MEIYCNGYGNITASNFYRKDLKFKDFFLFLLCSELFNLKLALKNLNFQRKFRLFYHLIFTRFISSNPWVLSWDNKNILLTKLRDLALFRTKYIFYDLTGPNV